MTIRNFSISGVRLLALFVAAALLATACTSDAESSTDADPVETESSTPSTAEASTTTTEVESATTSTAAPALTNTIDWMPCGDVECGTVDVPADYNDASQGTLSIAVNVLRAEDTDRRIGVLMVNPGGPGASGKDLAEGFAFGGFPEDITDRFDIVGFDPRGVGDSEPEFACGASGEQIGLLADIEDIVDEPDEVSAAEAAVQLCVDSMGPLAGRIHTDFVVRDMDEIRKAMGEEQISFLGYSYGSLIGTWYATLFPESVRAMVIDGANNPLDEVDTFEERVDSAREELQPIEDLLRESLEACVDNTCPIYNDGDPVAYYLDTVQKFDLINEANADNQDAGILALITPLYNEAQWPGLWEALADLQERDDPTLFSEFLEFQLGDDPGAVNITGHINCLDSWALRPDIDRERQLAEAAEFFDIEEQLTAEFPLIGVVDGGSASTCPFYDMIAPEPLAGPLDGGGVPILVVGNTSDPVTSFGESEELANEILSNGVLIRVDHASHTVYPANSCVNAVVNDVLIDIAFPTTDVECEREGLDTERILGQVCGELAPSQAPSFTDDQVDDVCDRFVAAAFERLGEDAVYRALFEDDADSGAAVFDVLLDEIDATGG